MADQDFARTRQADHIDQQTAADVLREFTDLVTPGHGVPQPPQPQSLPPERQGRGAPRHGRPARRGGFRVRWIAIPLVVLLVLAGGGALGAYTLFPKQVRTLLGFKDDYAGAGSGSTRVVIKPGDTGSSVADTLAARGVTKTSDAFYRLLLKTTPEPSLQPGTYRLAKEQSAATALRQLEDPSRRIFSAVTLPEGSTAAQILAATAKATGVSLEELQAAAKDYRSLGVPKQAPSIEGFLFPATYRFEPGTTPKAMLQAMVDRMNDALDEAGVDKSDRFEVLTLAGLVQKEGNGPDDAKVARVFLNRLKTGMRLQSDATVSYGAGGTTVVPTSKQYDDRNPFNTYRRDGLPAGPISSPGDDAIRAAVTPAKGSWLFFVTVNLATGKTVFSDTNEQHERASAQFDSWLAAHPEYKK